MPLSSWSTTAADNDDADTASGIAFGENQAPGSVNDSMRSLMAVLKGDFAKSHATNGYQKFPNGLILQWGSSVNAATDYAIAYPIAFPTSTLSASASPVGAPAATEAYSVTIASAASNSISVRTRLISNGGTVAAQGAMSILWIAVGF